ncbi:MAG TPA: hypothetical protein VGG83_10755 [Trebonia sp.]|jgi:hypothetical protein
MATVTARKSNSAKPKPAPEPQDAVPAAHVLFEKEGRAWTTTAGSDFGAALAYLRIVKAGKKIVEAEFELLERLLGADGLDTLLAAVKTREEWREAVGNAVNHALGAPEPEGN